MDEYTETAKRVAAVSEYPEKDNILQGLITKTYARSTQSGLSLVPIKAKIL